MFSYQSNDPQGLPELKFCEAVKVCFKKYVDFTGRPRRSEYWSFMVFTGLLALVSRFLDGLLDDWFGIEVLRMLAGYIVLLPSVAVAVRRLHDTGRSGWWMAPVIVMFLVTLVVTDCFDAHVRDEIMLIYMFYSLVLMVFFLQDSRHGENQYGPSPKYP